MEPYKLSRVRNISSIATRGDPAFRLRLPKQLIKALDVAAKQSGRSRNSEILLRLHKSLDEAPELIEPQKAAA